MTRNETVETHVIEFSVNMNRDALAKILTHNGLTRDDYSLNNGGVTIGWRITGPRWKLEWFAKRYGYPGQNPKLVPPTGIDALLSDAPPTGRFRPRRPRR